MIQLFAATASDIPSLIALAHETWMKTYTGLVPKEQIVYMLDRFYEPGLLKQQMEDPAHVITLAKEANVLWGYAHLLEQEDSMKLSKLYVKPDAQGKGIGGSLLKAMETEARQRGFQRIELCVNRGNPARYFYEKSGFQVVREADFPVGPYWMNDYVMQKDLFLPPTG